MSKNSGKILAISLLKCYYNNDNIDDSVERGQRSSLNSRLPLTRSGVHRAGPWKRSRHLREAAKGGGRPREENRQSREAGAGPWKRIQTEGKVD